MPEQPIKINERELEQIAGGRYSGPTFVYVLQPGDRLAVLAQRFGTTVRVLQELNELRDPEAVRPGRRLLIPQR